MSYTDQDLQKDVIYRTLENGDADAVPGTLMTGMFTQQEILDSANRIVQQFLLETGLVLKETSIPGVAEQARYPLPEDSIRPRRITWLIEDGPAPPTP